MQLGTFSGGGLGMGVAFSLYDNFSQTAAEIERSMGRLDIYTESIQNRVNTGFNQMAVGASLLGLSFATLMPIGYGAQIAAEFETAKVGLETFLHSREKVNEVFENIKEDAAVTPFNLKELLAANRALISTGVDADKARRDTLNLANAVAAVGGGADELKRMSVNMQQIRNLGKAFTRDILQFGYAGINIYGLLEKSTGKSKDELQEMKITYDMLTDAFKKAAQEGGDYFGALDRLSQTLAGRWATLQDYFYLAMGTLGEQNLPILHQLLTFAIELTKRFMVFVQTPLGKWLVGAATAAALLAGGLGLVMLAAGVTNFMVYQMAGAFGAQTKAAILATIANEGLAAGLWEVAVASAAALWEVTLIVAGIALFIYSLYKMQELLTSSESKLRGLGLAMMVALGPLGWLVGGISLLSKGLGDFDKLLNGTMDKAEGIGYFFQKIGGIIRGLGETLSSWNGKTFEMSENMERALGRLGIRDLVLDLTTWGIRLIEFFKGVGAAIKEWWGIVTAAADAIMTDLEKTDRAFGGLLFGIDRNTSAIEKWREMGVWAGRALAVALTAILIILVVMAGAALVVGTAMLIALAIPIAAGWALYHVISWIVNGVQWLIDKFKGLPEAARAAATGTLAAFNPLTGLMGMLGTDMGQRLVAGLLEGIKKAWTGIKNWFSEAFSGIQIRTPEGRGMTEVGRVTSDGTMINNVRDDGSIITRSPAASGLNQIAAANASKNVISPYVAAPESKPASTTANVNVYLDGDLITKKVIENLEMEDSRK